MASCALSTSPTTSATSAINPRSVPRALYRAVHRAWRVAAAGIPPHGPEFEAELVARLVYGAAGDRLTALRRLCIILPLLRPTRCRWVVSPVFRKAIRDHYGAERAHEMIAVMARGNVRDATRLPDHRRAVPHVNLPRAA